MSKALSATKDTPWSASSSASAAVANAAVVSCPGVSVIFSTPTTRATSITPEAIARSAARIAGAPPHQSPPHPPGGERRERGRDGGPSRAAGRFDLDRLHPAQSDPIGDKSPQ